MGIRRIKVNGLGSRETYKKDMICDNCGKEMKRLSKYKAIAYCEPCDRVEFVESLFRTPGGKQQNRQMNGLPKGV